MSAGATRGSVRLAPGGARGRRRAREHGQRTKLELDLRAGQPAEHGAYDRVCHSVILQAELAIAALTQSAGEDARIGWVE